MLRWGFRQRAHEFRPALVQQPSQEEDVRDIAEMLRRTEISSINSAALESIEDGIDQLARAYPYANADYLRERTRNGLQYITKQLEGRVPLRRHRELLVDAGWLFLLNACVRYDRGQREAANLSKAAALRIGEEAGHGEIKAWAWETPAWSVTPLMPAARGWTDSPDPTRPPLTPLHHRPRPV
ncbi:hypothetical protein [Streptomyces sp. NPDC058683]|uniref:hypothetical protein n=1 Tax=Streptomyces sp. NPDC058683 TaxID=3346597 RepID=UPI00365D6D89